MRQVTTAVTEHPAPVPQGRQRAELVLTWAVVSLPLGYGLFHAVSAALQLFHG